MLVVRPAGQYAPAAKLCEMAMAKLCEIAHPGTSDQFAVFMLRFLGDYRLLGMSPTPRRHMGVLLYETLLFGFCGYIKVDNRPLPTAYRCGQLSDGNPLFVLEKPIEDGPFVRYAVEAVQGEVAAKERLKSNRAGKP